MCVHALVWIESYTFIYLPVAGELINF